MFNLLKILLRREKAMLVRLFASEYLAGKLEIQDIPVRANLRANVIKYLKELGIEVQE